MLAIVTDTETTGLDAAVDRLVEIAGVQVTIGADGRGELGSNYSSLCNPGRPIPPESKAVHHITEEMVKHEILPALALRDMILELGEPLFWVAHNAPFDKPFLVAIEPELKMAQWIDTLRCAKHIWPDAPSYGNQVLRYWLDLKVDVPEGLTAHRALYDTLCTAVLFQEMLKERSVDELVQLSTKLIIYEKMPFGKHKDVPFAQIPKDYLQWILKQVDIDPDVKHTALHYSKNQGRLFE